MLRDNVHMVEIRAAFQRLYIMRDCCRLKLSHDRVMLMLHSLLLLLLLLQQCTNRKHNNKKSHLRLSQLSYQKEYVSDSTIRSDCELKQGGVKDDPTVCPQFVITQSADKRTCVKSQSQGIIKSTNSSQYTCFLFAHTHSLHHKTFIDQSNGTIMFNKPRMSFIKTNAISCCSEHDISAHRTKPSH